VVVKYTPTEGLETGDFEVNALVRTTVAVDSLQSEVFCTFGPNNEVAVDSAQVVYIAGDSLLRVRCTAPAMLPDTATDFSVKVARIYTHAVKMRILPRPQLQEATETMAHAGTDGKLHVAFMGVQPAAEMAVCRIDGHRALETTMVITAASDDAGNSDTWVGVCDVSRFALGVGSYEVHVVFDDAKVDSFPLSVFAVPSVSAISHGVGLLEGGLSMYVTATGAELLPSSVVHCHFTTIVGGEDVSTVILGTIINSSTVHCVTPASQQMEAHVAQLRFL
jgi:hypothetical protein